MRFQIFHFTAALSRACCRSIPAAVLIRLFRFACTAALMAVCMAASQAGAADAQSPVPPWQSDVERAHPLVGRVFRLSDGKPIEPDSLVQALAAADFVLLGEKHDNPDHHVLQAWLIDRLVAAGRHPAIVMEMLDTGQAPALARYLQNPAADAAGLGAAVDWAAHGWPDWTIYAPIAAAALRAGLPIVAGDMARDTQRAIARGGIAALPEPTRRQLDLASDFDAAQAASLSAELQASHCGQLPTAALPHMMDVQRARDAHLATALVGASREAGDGAVLIAGAGHVRRDRGVPWHLARLAPGRTVAVVALREVEHGANAVDDYGLDRRFDFVWLTPRVDDEDPCVRFGHELRRLRRP